MELNSISTPGISVLICCYNSALRLPETIKHLALQKNTGNLSWEIILINNNSTDATEAVAKAEWEQYHLSVTFKVVNESKAGLSYARKRGIAEAKYNYVLFCDDDNWLCDTYLADAFRHISSNATLAAVGGHGEEVLEESAPEWFGLIPKSSFALGPQGNNGGTYGESLVALYGAGLVIKKQIIKQLYEIGFESLLSDRKGKSLSSGGDYEYTLLFQIVGYKVLYCPELKFKHYITKDRLTKSYLYKLYKGFGEQGPVLDCYGFVYNKSTLTPRKQWVRLFFKTLFVTPLVFLFGKSRPRKAVLIMNIAYLKACWNLKGEYIRFNEKVSSIRDKYLAAF